MKSISFLLLFCGVILIVIGYYRNISKKTNYKNIEYRYLPESIYSQQIGSDNLMANFKKMFQDKSIK